MSLIFPDSKRKYLVDARPRPVTAKAFKPYGWVIEWPGPVTGKKNLFRIVTRESARVGWRIAYLVVRDRQIDKLERHPRSKESFEPVKGKAVLYVSRGKAPRKIEAFILDKPVILKKAVWHGIVTLGKEAHVKITENSLVKLQFFRL